MKTKMQMLPNGNYEIIVSPIQHECVKNSTFRCIEYGFKKGLLLKIEDGDPFEDGYGNEIQVNFCPFCGYQPERLSEKTSKEDAIV